MSIITFYSWVVLTKINSRKNYSYTPSTLQHCYCHTETLSIWHLSYSQKAIHWEGWLMTMMMMMVKTTVKKVLMSGWALFIVRCFSLISFQENFIFLYVVTIRNWIIIYISVYVSDKSEEWVGINVEFKVRNKRKCDFCSLVACVCGEVGYICHFFLALPRFL